MSFVKISRIILWVLMAVSIVFVALFYFGGDVAGTTNTPSEEPVITETLIKWAYVLFGIALVFSVVFPLVFLVTNLKSAIRAGIVLAIGGVLIFIAYQLSSGDVMNIVGYAGPDNVESTLRVVGTGLIFTYILGGLAILSIIVSSVSNLFR